MEARAHWSVPSPAAGDQRLLELAPGAAATDRRLLALASWNFDNGIYRGGLPQPRSQFATHQPTATVRSFCCRAVLDWWIFFF
uniref:Uncharacterized protein n=1 Tax=Arundo donax TaxID=35708 RepID=A0A0A9E0W2_ARUDO